MFGQTQIGSDLVGEAASTQFGRGVSLSSDGSIVAVGANGDGNGGGSGRVLIYKLELGTWIQIGTDIDGEAVADNASKNISLSSDGSIVAIGAPNNRGNGSNSGHVRIFKNVNAVWTQVGEDIDGEVEGDNFGAAVSLSSNGTIVAITSLINTNDDTGAGQVQIFKNINDVWTQVGGNMDGEAFDGISENVSLSSDGSTVAFGAIGAEYVRIFKNVNDVWTQVGGDIDGEEFNDQSGRSVSLSSDGSIVAIGANGNDGNGDNSGHVRIFKNVNNVWTQVGDDIDGKAALDESGDVVSLSSDGSVVAIGANGNFGNSIYPGYVRIFKNIGNVWTQVGIDINGDPAGDFFGDSVSLSSDGSTVAVGARGGDINGINSGHVRIYNLSSVLSIDNFLNTQINLYPNPVNDRFTIQLNQGLELEKVKIYNSLGQLISSTTKNVVSTTHLPQGVYLVEMVTEKGRASKKILVK